MYSDREITVIFQPHLYSRTNDFMDDFASSLSLSDKLILLEIYAAGTGDRGCFLRCFVTKM